MKKITVLTVAIALLFTMLTASIANASNIQVVDLKIVKVTYSEADKGYYLYTEKDETGGFWVLWHEVEAYSKIKKLVGKHARIIFEQFSEDDTEVEILDLLIY